MNWPGEPPLLLFRGLGGSEIAIVVVVLLLIFGAGRLPKIGASLGQSMRAFKNAVTRLDKEEGEGEKPEGNDIKSVVKDNEKST